MSWLNDPVQRTLDRSLDGLALRQSLIAGNLANIDTPGYQPRSVDFESVLQAALGGSAGGSSGGVGTSSSGSSNGAVMRTTDRRHLGVDGTPGATESAGAGGVAGGDLAPATFAGSIRNDGNAVDLESEMTALAESQLRFGAVSRLESGRLAMLRDAITGGR